MISLNIFDQIQQYKANNGFAFSLIHFCALFLFPPLPHRNFLQGDCHLCFCFHFLKMNNRFYVATYNFPPSQRQEVHKGFLQGALPSHFLRELSGDPLRQQFFPRFLMFTWELSPYLRPIPVKGVLSRFPRMLCKAPVRIFADKRGWHLGDSRIWTLGH